VRSCHVLILLLILPLSRAVFQLLARVGIIPFPSALFYRRKFTRGVVERKPRCRCSINAIRTKLIEMPIHVQAAYNLWLLAAGGASYGARYMTHRWRTARLPQTFSDEDPLDELLSLQETYGYNAHSLVSACGWRRAIL